MGHCFLVNYLQQIDVEFELWHLCMTDDPVRYATTPSLRYEFRKKSTLYALSHCGQKGS